MCATYPGATTGPPSYSGCPGLVGFGPSGFARLPSPFPFAIASWLLFNTRTAVGYQPVGINPNTRLRGPEISVSATAFASEHTTYNRSPAVSTARAEGVMPSGCRGEVETLILSRTLNCPSCVTPTEYTLFRLDAAT